MAEKASVDGNRVCRDSKHCIHDTQEKPSREDVADNEAASESILQRPRAADVTGYGGLSDEEASESMSK